jgi:uncharacterized protein YaiI (UPF0178 family)
MKVIVDGDGCEKLEKIINICRKDCIELHVYHDIDHEIDMDYGVEHFVMTGVNSADYAILSACRKGDVVITRDVGLASMVLSMNVACLNENGREFINRDIDSMLANRYMTTLEHENGIKSTDRGKRWLRAKKKNFDTLLPKMIEREKLKYSVAG